MVTIYRIIHACGWVEFLNIEEAQEYRDANYSGCLIEEIQRDMSDV